MTASSYSKIVCLAMGLAFLFISSSISAQSLVLTGPINVESNARSAKSKIKEQMTVRFVLLPCNGQDTTKYFADYSFYKNEINAVFIHRSARKSNDLMINRKQRRPDLFCFEKVNARMNLLKSSANN
jgi:hypothetical protein